MLKIAFSLLVGKKEKEKIPATFPTLIKRKMREGEGEEGRISPFSMGLST